MAARAERHTTGHTRDDLVLVTVVADEGVLYTDPLRLVHESTGAVIAPLPHGLRMPRGAEIRVSKAVLGRWLNADPPKVVVVDEAKLGAAQKRLLLKLLDIDDTAKASPLKTWRARATKWYGPTDIGRGHRWRSSSMIDGPATSSARSSVAQALANLERRGLVLRDGGPGRRTTRVHLSQAGIRVARALREAEQTS